MKKSDFPPIKPAEKITPERAAKLAGHDSLADLAREALFSGTAPACCSKGCIVEPDGTCPHGFPSALRAAGYV